MRDFKGMKRQRNRNRGGGGGKPQHNANRAFDSNGPDGVKVRGAAQHIYEKYQQLARDATSSGDRVLAENYLQHAEHYFRVLRAMQPQRPVGEIIGRDQFASGYDIDFEEEPAAAEAATEEAEADGAGEPGRREERPWAREDRPRDEFRQRDDRPREDFRQRDDRSREDFRSRDEPRQRDDRFRDDRQGRGERPRDDRRSRDERPFRFEREPRPEREARDPIGLVEPRAAPFNGPAAAPAPEEQQPAGGMLRGEDGTVSAAPAFLQTRANEPRAEGEEPGGESRRPRRRRAPRSFEAAEGGAAVPADADEG
ncbi:MAG: DUF4167 domain-containing protein [Caulobacteraceae bacterium]|nr:DUF4167 domain-containing protein [Caulobacteraceae bacterium]